MDMSYATIPIFAEQRRLCRENSFAYMISSLECPQNHAIYSIETDLDFAIFYNDSSNEQSNNVVMVMKA